MYKLPVLAGQPSLAANCTDRKLTTARTPEADKGPGWNNAACKSGCAHCKRFLAQALRQRPPDACQRVWSNMRLQPMTCTRWSNCKLVFRLVLALAGNIQSAIARVTIPSSWESALASSMSLQAITHNTAQRKTHASTVMSSKFVGTVMWAMNSSVTCATSCWHQRNWDAHACSARTTRSISKSWVKSLHSNKASKLSGRQGRELRALLLHSLPSFFGTVTVGTVCLGTKLETEAQHPSTTQSNHLIFRAIHLKHWLSVRSTRLRTLLRKERLAGRQPRCTGMVPNVAKGFTKMRGRKKINVFPLLFIWKYGKV